jgi:hypothetical protein
VKDCYAHPQDKQRVNLYTALSVADIPSPTGTKEPARRHGYAESYVFFIFYIDLSTSARSSDLSLMVTPKILTYLSMLLIKFPHSMNMVCGVTSVASRLWHLHLSGGRQGRTWPSKVHLGDVEAQRFGVKYTPV